jgi:death on curing protein
LGVWLFSACPSSFGGKSPYADMVEIAAANLFYICKNHPFLDGNERTAMMSAIVFLRLNGMAPLPDSMQWEKLMLDVAASEIDRDETTRRLRKLLASSRTLSELKKSPRSVGC